jgi:hypothetical protein
MFPMLTQNRRRSLGGGGVECTEVPTAVGPRAVRENGNYKHGRYTAEVAATRRWLREAIHTLHELKKRP